MKLAGRKAYVIAPDGTITEVAPKNGRDFKLEELYTHCRCDCVERTVGSGRINFWLDEEGKLNGKLANPVATALGHQVQGLMPDDWFAGHVLVCPERMVR